MEKRPPISKKEFVPAPIVNGTPHVTYQHPGYDINFMWTGHPKDLVQVCPYGYMGEPMFFFEIALKEQEGFYCCLQQFGEECAKWLLAHPSVRDMHQSKPYYKASHKKGSE